jgi:hypothetical protein
MKGTAAWNIAPTWVFACDIAMEVLRNPEADRETIADCRDIIKKAAALAEKYRLQVEAEA